MALRTSLVALAITLLLVVGCGGARGDGGVVSVTAWTLEAPSGARAAVKLPAHVGDHLAPSDARYTLRSDVPIPAAMRGSPLTLAILLLHGHATLVAGDAVMEPLDAGPETGYRHAGAKRWRIPADAARGDHIALALTIDNRWSQATWLDTPPRLSATPRGDPAFLAARAFNYVSAAAAMSLAIFAGYLYAVIFLSDRRRVMYAWFALTGLASVVYPSFVVGWAVDLLGPFEEAAVSIGLCTAVVCNMYFTHAVFHLPRPSRAWGYALVPIAAASIVSLFVRHVPIIGPVTVAMLVPAIVHQDVVFVRLLQARPRPVNVITILFPWALVGAIALPDFVAWCGLGEMLGGLRTASFGICAIALFQTTALSREHMFSLRREGELSAERAERIALLETKNREVVLLNEELRRQIAARSSHLADALARLDGSTAEIPALEIGDAIDGRYDVVRAIGEGGAGSVYEVVRRNDCRRFALKVVRGEANPQMLARLAREAQLVAQIEHAHVISIVDVEIAQAGFLYIVMELVDGPSLRDLKPRFGERRWALSVLRQIAEGLAAIHAHGIVHRDLKPGNVLVIPATAEIEPIVKIADFGIASAFDADEPTVASGRRDATPARTPTAIRVDGSLTETGMLLGTPFYMAPELVDGAKNAQPSADLFSFGMIAVELLTGSSPFLDPPAVRRLNGQSDRPPPSIACLCDGLTIDLADLLDRCLSLEPAARPTAGEVALALAQDAARGALAGHGADATKSRALWRRGSEGAVS
jgi:serine/threonine-protein kinase